MNEPELIKELVHFAADQLKILGDVWGPRYLEKCFVVWAEQFGEAVVAKVRKQVLGE
jgi:hypothetical protein